MSTLNHSWLLGRPRWRTNRSPWIHADLQDSVQRCYWDHQQVCLHQEWVCSSTASHMHICTHANYIRFFWRTSGIFRLTWRLSVSLKDLILCLLHQVEEKYNLYVFKTHLGLKVSFTIHARFRTAAGGSLVPSHLNPTLTLTQGQIQSDQATFKVDCNRKRKV